MTEHNKTKRRKRRQKKSKSYTHKKRTSRQKVNIKKNKSKKCKHGYQYGPLLKNYCNCYQIFKGKNCNKIYRPRLLDATNSQISFVSHWLQKNVKPYVVSPTYELNYLAWQYPHSSILLSDKTHLNVNKRGENINKKGLLSTNIVSKVLYNSITELHNKIGNAIVKDKYIVIGNGATNLINALLYTALRKYGKNNKDITAGAPAPFWPHFRTTPTYIIGITNIISSKPHALHQRTLDLEFITVPNNPDNDLNLVARKDTKMVSHDLVYYWPSCMGGLTPIPTRNDDIMLFSLSKLSGNSATRFGWALVKDKAVAESMNTYLRMSELSISTDAQLRAISVLSAINKNIGTPNDMMPFIWTELEKRWRILNDLFIKSKNFTIASKHMFNYIVWIKSVKNENAFEIFKRHGIIGEYGVEFGGDKSFIRLNIGQEIPVFKELIKRLKKFL